MNLLNKLTIKNLKLNKKRTIVTIIGIILSVALICAVATMYNSGINSLISYEKYQVGDFHVKFANVSANDLNNFKNNRKIENIYLTKDIGYAKIDSQNESKPYAFVKEFTHSALENLSIKLVEGRLPENDNEILIPTHLKTNGRMVLSVGDSITLLVGKRTSNGEVLNQSNPVIMSEETNEIVDEEIVDTISKTYKIVGIIQRPATNIESYTAPGYTFVTLMNNENLDNVDVYAKFNKDGLSDVYKVTANILGVDEELFEKYYTGKMGDEEQLNKFSEEMEKAKYQIDINTYLIDLETNPIESSNIAGLGVVAIIVCLIIVVTSVFCIKNSFDISITEKIKQYGMLRSVGATKKQIRRNVFYEATILGVIAIPIGILLGLFASYILVIVSNYFLSDALAEHLKLIFTFSILPIIIAVVLGIVTVYASAFGSARKASRVSPIDSIRNSANIKINAKKIKAPKIINKIFGIGGEISYKNLKRNRKKYRTTVISIIVSVAVFIALSSFINLAFRAVEGELNMSEYNISLSANGIKNNNINKYIETTRLDTIEDFSIIRQSDIILDKNHYNQEYIDFAEVSLDEEVNNYLTIMVIGDEQYKKYIKSLGLDYEDVKDKGILNDYTKVSRYNEEKQEHEYKYLRMYEYNKGDYIKGTINNKDINIEITCISDTKPFGLKNVDSTYLIISDELFDKIAETPSIQIFYKSNNADKLQDDIESMLKNENYSLNNIAEDVRIMNNLFTLVAIFLYGFIIVISLIGITNIFNTITTNMSLRSQEFASLKSIGMTNREFNKMIRLESLFMGIKSLLFGIPLGIILSSLIHMSLGEELKYQLPIKAIIISIIAVFILINVLMKYSIRKINKQNIIETIRNENI